MNMSTRPKQKKNEIELNILDRKTDKTGRTFYQIEWLDDSKGSNNITWEPLINLKEHYKLIQDFEVRYQERVTQWNPTYNTVREYHDSNKQISPMNSSQLLNRNQESITKQDPPKNNTVLSNRNNQGELSKKRYQIEYENDNLILIQYKNRENRNSKQKDQQNNRSKEESKKIITIPDNNKQMQAIGIVRQEIETLDKSSLGEQSNKNKQLTVMELNNSKTEPNNNFQLINQRITRLIRKNKKNKPRRTSKIVTKKYGCPRQPTFVKQQKVLKIKQIFATEEIWYASVLMEGDVDKIILRDQLRICQPQILLNFYENQMEQKRRDVV